MTIDRFTFLYLDYVNNFLSVAAFAEYYDITNADALVIIGLGRTIQDLVPRQQEH